MSFRMICKILLGTYMMNSSRFYPEIFEHSGAPKMVDTYGNWFTHDKTPRAKIFKRDHEKVKYQNKEYLFDEYTNKIQIYQFQFFLSL